MEKLAFLRFQAGTTAIGAALRATLLYFPQIGSKGQLQRYATPCGESRFSANSGQAEGTPRTSVTSALNRQLLGRYRGGAFLLAFDFQSDVDELVFLAADELALTGPV